MNSLDWNLLRAFLAVVDHRSLSGAAARTRISQPTLSRQIRELEAVLGTTLFTRSARGLQPTEAGLALVENARAMGAAAEAFARKGHGRSQAMTGTVRITASSVFATLILPEIIVELREAEPQIHLELVASDVSQNLLRRDADIAIRHIDPTQGSLIARKLGAAPLGLFGAKSYLAKRGTPHHRSDLMSHDVIGYDRDEAIIQGLAANGLSVGRNHFPIRCDDQIAGWTLLLAGAGLGFAPMLLGTKEDRLVPIDIGLAIPLMPVWLVMHEDVRTNARIQKVAGFIANRLIAKLR